MRTAGRGRRAGVRAQDGRGAGRRARCGPAARPHTDAPPSHPPTPRAWHPSAALVPGLCLAASCMLSAVSRAICHARSLPATFAAARLRSCTEPGLARREPPLCIPQGDLCMAAPACAGVDAERLFRVLRAAVQLGVFAVDAAPRSGRAGAPARAPRFRNNRLSAVLREDHPNCIKDIVRHPAGALPCAVSCSRFCLLLRAAACVPREPLTPVQALLSNHKHGEPHHAGHHVNQVAPVSCGACVRSERMCPNYCLCMGCPRMWRRGACSLRRQPCLTRERPPCRSATWPRITNRPGARARSFPPACAACRGLGLARRAGSGRYFCTVHWAQFLARAGRLARGRPLSAGRRRRAALRPDEPSCPT